ncbi:MAG TPA: hypothetical protein VFR87_05605 [Nocardioidaceae bacterium]|nr:hypothetical protein [Nocardioidaceae bacterium]
MARRTSTTNPKHDPGHGMLQATIDVFLDRTRALTELMANVGGEALGRVPEPVPSAVNRMLSSLRQLAEQAPPLTAELDVLIEEVHAKRLSIQALQAELSALDHQLEVLESSLKPVEAWSRNWRRLQHTLAESLNLPQEPVG